jgi:hypothetical protein
MLRQAAELGESEDKNDQRNDEHQWLARDEQQDGCAKNRGYHQVSQNCQSKIHGHQFKRFFAARKKLV